MTETLDRTTTFFARARTTALIPAQRSRAERTVRPAALETGLEATAEHMFSLMLRNAASEGFQFTDPADPSKFSRPGCIIAAPSYPAGQPGVDQDYVFNWMRDAAITAMEIAAARMPARPGSGVQALIDYVHFAKFCQDNATPTLAHACYTIEGYSRPWTEQADGPALQTVALLQAFAQLDQPAQAVAREVVGKNLDFILGHYLEPTFNVWEEHLGYSFFARAAQLRCLRAVAANTVGIAVPGGIGDVISWLETALQGHWNGTCYLSVLAQSDSGPVPVTGGYDPNIDIVLATVYGGIAFTDTRMLATAAQLRFQWAHSSSPVVYPINVTDAHLGMGPLMGRYPGDTYDGDLHDPVPGGHPWAMCTAAFAELYYQLARDITRTQSVPHDELSSEFFGQVGIGPDTSPTDAVILLHNAADAMLQAIIYHSSDLELSEQFDGTSGYEKSVRDLTWSYAAFLSAARAKTNRNVAG
jgi:glucoamylase